MRLERPITDTLDEHDPPTMVLEPAVWRGWNVYAKQSGQSIRCGHRWTRKGAERHARRLLRDYQRWVDKLRTQTTTIGGADQHE